MVDDYHDEHILFVVGPRRVMHKVHFFDYLWAAIWFVVLILFIKLAVFPTSFRLLILLQCTCPR